MLTSLALQTIASSFALFASLACWKTICLTFLLNPISFKDLLSRDVSIVTPTNLVLFEAFLAAFKASRPELMWIVK